LTSVGSSTVQYTFTHKQYTEYTEGNVHNNYKEKLGRQRKIWEDKKWEDKEINCEDKENWKDKKL
jgi:hypothetical protein